MLSWMGLLRFIRHSVWSAEVWSWSEFMYCYLNMVMTVNLSTIITLCMWEIDVKYSGLCNYWLPGHYSSSSVWNNVWETGVCLHPQVKIQRNQWFQLLFKAYCGVFTLIFAFCTTIHAGSHAYIILNLYLNPCIWFLLWFICCAFCCFWYLEIGPSSIE